MDGPAAPAHPRGVSIDSPCARGYRRNVMTQRWAAARIVLIVLATCLIGFAVVSSAHVHQRARDALHTDCPLCAVGQVRAGVGDRALAALGLVLLGWAVCRSTVMRPSGNVLALPAPRAPPLR